MENNEQLNQNPPVNEGIENEQITEKALKKAKNAWNKPMIW